MVIILIPTTRCNLNCPYCLNHSAQGLPPNEVADMSIETVDKILYDNRMEYIHVIHVTGGEPCLRFDVIEHILTKYPTYRFVINTNGTILFPDNIISLLSRKSEVRMSIDSIDEIPSLYNQLKFKGHRLMATGLIDFDNPKKTLDLFQHFQIMDLERYMLSTDYLIDFSAENDAKVINFAELLSKQISTITMDKIERYAEFHKYCETRDSAAEQEIQPEVHRYSPAGILIPTIAGAHVHESIQHEDHFPKLTEMSKRLEDSMVTFEYGNYDSVFNASVYYACLIFETLRRNLYGKRD